MCVCELSPNTQRLINPLQIRLVYHEVCGETAAIMSGFSPGLCAVYMFERRDITAAFDVRQDMASKAESSIVRLAAPQTVFPQLPDFLL